MIKRNIPNILSILRLLSVPAFIINFFLNYNNNLIVSIAIFAFSGLTDVVDGAYARKYNCITKLGKILDPLADKMIQIGVLITLTFSKIIPFEILIVFGIKEIITLLGSILIYKKKSYITVSNTFGKLSTVSFYITMIAIMIIYYLKSGNLFILSDSSYYKIIIVLCLITVTFAVIAIIKYIKQYRKYLIDDKNNEELY